MRALIVGAGVAGPVLASFLAEVGIEPVVCEARAASSAAEGAFLGVAPNGMQVLAALGIAREVEARGLACEGFRFLSSAGEAVGTIDHRGDPQRYGERLVMIRRGALHEALLAEASRRGVPVRFGARLAELDRSDPSCVVARFEGGSEEIADVVIGCDGLRSRTRALLFPDAPPPSFTGLLDFGGYARPGREPPLELGWNVMVFGRRAFFGAFRTHDDVWWFHNGPDTQPLRDLAPDARRARILEAHAEDAPWIADCIRATPEVLGPWPIHEVYSLARWHVGRVGLIGDAAHATSPSAGQGASLALEDAMTLARCLRDELDPERAFARLHALRRARVDEIVRHSRRNSSAKAMPGPLAAKLRDLALPLFLKLGARAQQRAYAHRVEW